MLCDQPPIATSAGLGPLERVFTTTSLPWMQFPSAPVLLLFQFGQCKSLIGILHKTDYQGISGTGITGYFKTSGAVCNTTTAICLQ